MPCICAELPASKPSSKVSLSPIKIHLTLATDRRNFRWFSVRAGKRPNQPVVNFFQKERQWQNQ